MDDSPKKNSLGFVKLREKGRQERKWIDDIKEIIGLSFKRAPKYY